MELVWATGRHAWRGGHGQLHSCSAWIPPVPCQEKRVNEGGRGSQRVSRSDLCWHCMSVPIEKKEGEGDTHLACSCCCPLVACQPLRCAVLVCHAHTHMSLLLLLNIIVQHHAHGACACMFVSVPSVQHTQDVRRKEGGERVVCSCCCFVFV